MSKIQIRITAGTLDTGHGKGWVYTALLGGAIVAQGWSEGGKREARREAKRALEEMGLITDGADGWAV